MECILQLFDTFRICKIQFFFNLLILIYDRSSRSEDNIIFRMCGVINRNAFYFFAVHDPANRFECFHIDSLNLLHRFVKLCCLLQSYNPDRFIEDFFFFRRTNIFFWHKEKVLVRVFPDPGSNSFFCENKLDLLHLRIRKIFHLTDKAVIHKIICFVCIHE